MVRANETYEVEGITVRIMEVIPYTTFSGRKELLISYRIEDGRFTSPIAHFWMREGEDPRPYIERIVSQYKAVKNIFR